MPLPAILFHSFSSPPFRLFLPNPAQHLLPQRHWREHPFPFRQESPFHESRGNPCGLKPAKDSGESPLSTLLQFDRNRTLSLSVSISQDNSTTSRRKKAWEAFPVRPPQVRPCEIPRWRNGRRRQPLALPTAEAILSSSLVRRLRRCSPLLAARLHS